MSGCLSLVLGLMLGMRHALDADHVVVLATLMQRETNVSRAARIAALWGIGHSVALLGLGVCIVVAGVRIPAGFEVFATALVSVMLITVGSWHLYRTLIVNDAVSHDRAAAAVFVRPLAVGVVHGLAGSAAVALLALTTIANRTLALAYLAVFAAGTVLGMVVLTLALAWPLTRMATDSKHRRALNVVAAVASIAVGLAVASRMALTPE